MRRLSTSAIALLVFVMAGCANTSNRPGPVEPTTVDAILEGTRPVDVTGDQNPVRVAQQQPVGTDTISQQSMSAPTESAAASKASGFPDSMSKAPLLPASALPVARAADTATQSAESRTSVAVTRNTDQAKPSTDRSPSPASPGGLSEPVRLSEPVSSGGWVPSKSRKPENYARASETIKAPRRRPAGQTETEISLASFETQLFSEPLAPAIVPAIAGTAAEAARSTSAVNLPGLEAGPAPVEPHRPITTIPDTVARSETATSETLVVSFRGAIKSASGGLAAQVHVAGQGTFTVREGDEVPLLINGDDRIYTVRRITNGSVQLESPHGPLLAK